MFSECSESYVLNSRLKHLLSPLNFFGIILRLLEHDEKLAPEIAPPYPHASRYNLSVTVTVLFSDTTNLIPTHFLSSMIAKVTDRL